jgi:hypothetical protein
MKRWIVPLALLAMGGLLAVAVAVDCVRLAADAQHRVQLADAELAKHETRLVKLLAGSKQLSPEVDAALAAYRASKSWPARHAAYEQVVACFRQMPSGGVDPTNPLDRKFMDDTAGAINRREIAEKPFDEEFAAHQAYLNSWRGRIARWFSPTAQADWEAMR